MQKPLDETNKAIIRSLTDGRKPYSAIAEALNITENTVRARVNRMVEEGILQITGLINPDRIPGLQVVQLGVKLKTLDLERKAREFCHLRGVVSVTVVTGRYDLFVTLVLSDDEELSLLNFYKHELDQITEIAEVEAYVVCQGHNFRVPYIL
ncbi:MAG TPA: Lrp/AsnC family transcriptional regulator [Sphaerochaeta sp.]|nr:Lrp/AsnC family transcriptional regulator [Sphaerochaeta sp.]